MDKVVVAFIILVALFVKSPNCIDGAKAEDIGVDDIEEGIYSEVGMEDIMSYPELELVGYGASMEPIIHDKSTCLCRKTEDYQKGDIIAYFQESKNGHMFIVHRITELVNEDSFITKGDNNIYIDPWAVNRNQIACEVEQVSTIEKLAAGGGFV